VNRVLTFKICNGACVQLFGFEVCACIVWNTSYVNTVVIMPI